ncbi:MAG: hypothetical protein ACD_56C00150G0013 [uncultured bacterium]|nr:MAG: hypothetical protein ACD_56C00150G0013 [uncultured bacterium]
MNMLAAKAEMSVRTNLHEIKPSKSFVKFMAERYFSEISQLAKKQDEFSRRMAEMLLKE